jgi:hypothetical protein
MVIALIVVMARTAVTRRQPRESQRATDFALYLGVVGVTSLVAYWLFAPNGIRVETMRYDLLAILGPVGVVAGFWSLERSRRWKAAIVGALTVWAAVSGVSHGRLFWEYWSAPPPNHARQAVEALLADRVTCARSTYWTAYRLTFLADERLILSSDDLARIVEYQRQADAMGEHAERIRHQPCTDGVHLAGEFYRCPQ